MGLRLPFSIDYLNQQVDAAAAALEMCGQHVVNHLQGSKRCGAVFLKVATVGFPLSQGSCRLMLFSGSRHDQIVFARVQNRKRRRDASAEC